jgi:hypothetical protein
MEMAKKKGKKPHRYGEHHDIYENWVDFSKDISDRINYLTHESTSEYNELYKIWSEYVQEMTEHMANYSPEDTDAFEEMQRIWTHYSGKIGEKFVDALSSDNGSFKELYQMWTEYSGKMSQNLSELLSENIKSQKELYELWMDSFGIKDKSYNPHPHDVYEDMGQFWMKMWEHSWDMHPSAHTRNTDFNATYKELSDFWAKNYSKWVANFMRSPEFAKMNGEILDSNLETIRANQEYWTQYFSTMGIPTKENIDEIYQKLTDLDRKISEVNRSLKSKKRK